MNEHRRAYWRLLDLTEDYLRFGERTAHDDPPSATVADPAPCGVASTGRDVDHEADEYPGSDAEPVEGRTAVFDPADAADRDRPDALPAVTDGAVAADDDGERGARRRRLSMLEERVRACTRCALHEGRFNAVPGVGVLDPLVMVIGEGPGADEDRRGLPFVGRAGQFLDKWLEAVGLSRASNAYITNIVKCRPPENRDPRPAESDACMPYLKEQIELVRPQTILTVGRIASGVLIGTGAGIGSLRGRTDYYNGIPLVPTYHPSGVLRNPELKRPVWEDLKRLNALLDRGSVG